MVGILNDGVQNLIKSIGYVLVFIGLDYYTASYVPRYTWLFVAGGLALIVYAHTKLKDKKIISTSVGLIGAVIIFLGVKHYIFTSMIQYVWAFIFGGMFIYLVADEITGYLS